MKYLLHYIEKKKLIIIFSLITIFQAFNALGTYALAKAGLAYHDKRAFAVWIIASIVCFIFSPMFNILIRRMESELSFSSYQVFIKDQLFSKSGKANLWQTKSAKDHFLASIGSDANDYLGMILFISMDIYSFGLSVVLGVLTLSLTIDMSLLPAFIVSGVLSYFIFRAFSKKVENLYGVDQASRTALGGHILKSWDNVLLNNRDIVKKYLETFEVHLKSAQTNAKTSSTGAECLVFALGVAAGLPVLASVIWILFGSSAGNESEILIALLATLPRQLNILGLFRNIYQSLTSLLSVEAKFEVICNGCKIPTRELINYIKPETISINSKAILDVPKLLADFSKNPKGRFEVRGPNGSGKSTLLLHMNNSLKSSIYLPTHPNLMIEDSEKSRSSGENLLAHIEALSKSEENIILLDEWDANLDGENLVMINEFINTLAERKTVIEVRHR